jgi:cytoskeletal protein CcmA (bactofilin family)
MNQHTLISATTHVRGYLRGEGDLEIEGRITGEIEVTGQVTIHAGALIKANITGDKIVVRGAIRGDIVGLSSILLEEGARVVGNLSSPSVGVGEGALIRGRVETADMSDSAPTIRRHSPAHLPAAHTPAAPPVAKAAARSEGVAATTNRSANHGFKEPATGPYQGRQPAIAAAPPAPAARRSYKNNDEFASPPPPVAVVSSKREPEFEERHQDGSGPPPPVVPSLRKGSKVSFKKKSRRE